MEQEQTQELAQYAIAVMVNTWVSAEDFRRMPAAAPFLSDRFVFNLEDRPGEMPQDPVILAAMEQVTRMHEVRAFDAVSLEIPERHKFIPDHPVEEGTYIWLRWVGPKKETPG
jgi:hypothetical protein